MSAPKVLHNQLRLFLPMMVLAIVGAFLFGGHKSYAATKTWTGGGGDSNLSTAGNWTGGAPSSGDDLVFPAPSGSSTDVTLTASFTANSITINGDSNASDLYNIYFNAASAKTLTVSSTITVGHKVGISTDSDTTLAISTGGSISAKNDANVVIGGPLAVGTGTITIGIDSTPTLSSELGGLTIASGVTGSGVLNIFGMLTNIANNNGYSGSIVMNKSRLTVDAASDIGTSTSALTMIASRLSLGPGSGDLTIANDITFNGNYLGASNADAEIGSEAIYHGGGAGTYTLSGDITLLSDILVDPYTGPLSFTGSLAGSYLFGITSVYQVESKLIVNASPNTSLIANGTYTLVDGEVTISDSDANTDLLTQRDTTLVINGVRGKIILSSGSYLKGTGTVGDVNIFTNSHLAPGQSPGCLNTGSLSFSENSNYDVDVNGATVCSGYDKATVTGTVALSNANLNVSLGSYKPAVGTSFTIIQNDGSDAVSGTFKNLANGATFTVGTKIFKINYAGGDGNDVVLTVVSTPNSPATGFKTLGTSFAGVAVATVSGFAMLSSAKRTRRTSRR